MQNSRCVWYLIPLEQLAESILQVEQDGCHRYRAAALLDVVEVAIVV